MEDHAGTVQPDNHLVCNQEKQFKCDAAEPCERRHCQFRNNGLVPCRDEIRVDNFNPGEIAAFTEKQIKQANSKPGGYQRDKSLGSSPTPALTPMVKFRWLRDGMHNDFEGTPVRHGIGHIGYDFADEAERLIKSGDAKRCGAFDAKPKEKLTTKQRLTR
jgi:hypothetical protein